MAKMTGTWLRAPGRVGSSKVAIATASLFIALATVVSLASDGQDDARSLRLRGSLASNDPGAAPVSLPAAPKRV